MSFIPKDDYERIVSRVVEGQITSFLLAHPEIAEAVRWRHSHKTKAEALTSSIAKRITRDLVCQQTRRRIEEALEVATEAPPTEHGTSAVPEAKGQEV